MIQGSDKADIDNSSPATTWSQVPEPPPPYRQTSGPPHPPAKPSQLTQPPAVQVYSVPQSSSDGAFGDRRSTTTGPPPHYTQYPHHPQSPPQHRLIQQTSIEGQNMTARVTEELKTRQSSRNNHPQPDQGRGLRRTYDEPYANGGSASVSVARKNNPY